MLSEDKQHFLPQTNSQTLPPPVLPSLNASPMSTRLSPKRTMKLKRASPNRQAHRLSHQSKTPTPSISSTTSSLSSAKNFLSSWVGNLRAGVSGAWTKAKGETETYLASQEGESRMQRRRKEILNEPVKLSKGGPGKLASAAKSMVSRNSVGDETGVGEKRPATSDGEIQPASKKRTLNAKKIKKQKSLGRLAFGKRSISYPKPPAPVPSPPPARLIPPPAVRVPAAPVYRSTAPQEQDAAEDGLRTKVQTLETEITALRAKVRWFEQSYGEIPANTMADIQHSLMESSSPTKKARRSVFTEELGGTNEEDVGESHTWDQSILPNEIKELKGMERNNINPIAEEAEISNTDEPLKRPNNVWDFAAPETTVKLIHPSPSSKSVAISPPRPARPAPSSPNFDTSVLSSPGGDDIEKSIDLLETLSPIHPNIIPALVPRNQSSVLSKETMHNKLQEYAE